MNAEVTFELNGHQVSASVDPYLRLVDLKHLLERLAAALMRRLDHQHLSVCSESGLRLV